MSKWKWKKYIKERTKTTAFTSLVFDNSSKKKTKNILYSEFEMKEYLKENVSLSLSRTIFSLRSKTLDIKEFQSWKYSDNICVKCKKHEETINHFVSCPSYETDIENNLNSMNPHSVLIYAYYHPT